MEGYRGSVCSFEGITCNAEELIKEIELSNQNLTGALPLNLICQLQSLDKLSLRYNLLENFTGEELSNCVKLQYLDLGNNVFEGPFPDQILELKKLNFLDLGYCGIKGRIPRAIGNLTVLTDLQLQNNGLSGKIPMEIGKLHKLRRLQLYDNRLQGKLPVGLRNLTKLEYLDVSRNQLEGNISLLRYLTNMVSLQLTENLFTGIVPAGIWGLPKMVTIDITSNQFEGPITSDIKNAKEIRRLSTTWNKLSGELPEEISEATSLEIIELSSNQFWGKIPRGIRELKRLSSLELQYNRLSGSIPESLSSCRSITVINMAHNHLAGKIPRGIGELKGLSSLELQYNRLSGSIPESLSSCRSITVINMAHNHLAGKIPRGIGVLKGLSSLELQENGLSGSIPSSLGSSPLLDILDLSQNEFSGNIPKSLSSHSWSVLYLSNNRLSGPTPLSLVTAASERNFEGNPGLCSSIIKSFRQCPPDSGMSKDVRKKDHGPCLKEKSWEVKSFHRLTFSENEILDSLQQQNLIGRGGSGNVYKATLSNGLDLAVKHIWLKDSHASRRSQNSKPIQSKRDSKPKEFDTEVRTLSSIRHVNVVKLYCSMTSQDSTLLVYEYLPNGSLWDRLHTCRETELDWDPRYHIAVGAAKGLEYLHHGCERSVIHRDIKSSNILLDEFLKPRIADFGLAKMVQANGGKDSTHVIVGTHGYIAPEYCYTYKVNEKSDVYSFGVVLMELVIGKRPTEPEYGDDKDIVTWVLSKTKDKASVLGIIDPRIADASKEYATKVLKIAIFCTNTLAALRPTMRTVVQMLEAAEPRQLVTVAIG
ncbi:hypothetical protein GOBAR_DD11688 [Gossypium barbadense]|nr:hypothetical protein GOBAR_DD11688 [Gossypium barbadense]